MSFTQLRITGPDSAPYVLGAPMHLYERDFCVGIMDPVPVSAGGTEVHIEHFNIAADTPAHQRREIGRLVLLEVVAFLAENFADVQAVSLALSRDIEGYSDGMTLASARSATLQSIGARHIMITPKPDAAHAGHFVVAGLWEYNQANLAALMAHLQKEREAYRERDAAAAKTRAPGLFARWWAPSGRA
ncbi:hypothetical protein SRS16CHR_03868 [Variovorax sp. SRS16]|uniref:hypothetical protein n=1 Tax=Variovorax sp. SRS16 TaxID=282217 RepID=UPI0013184742|nr:hypothetical protein [Variovorax sp. SRS16]VTU26488.1 hypothetical protein SRS16CHR_03868 [Variovorax sp. SRS16]